MGYEISYHYHEKKDGVYNKDEIKVLKKKLGEPFEDVQLEKAAAAIMSQLARRDIFVVDVKINELIKKEVSFKESNGGIILKNRKFLFDQAATVVEEINNEEKPKIHPHEKITKIHPHEKITNNNNPIDYMVYSPELRQQHEVKNRNIKLTVDKKYPIYEKKLNSNGITNNLKIIDDSGKEVIISDEYFIPGKINLFGDKELGFSENKNEIQLNWAGAIDDVPVLRK